MTGSRTIAARSRAGFTMVELMVSLTVGGIAITSIYAIGSASTRVFHQQQQLANAQTALRMALTQVKRDVARAGFLSTPNGGAVGQTCGGLPAATLHGPGANPATPLAGITKFENDVLTDGSYGTNQNASGEPAARADNVAAAFTIDDVVLIGNYETAAEYPGVTLLPGNTIRLSDNWHAFRRDFTNWWDPTPIPRNDMDAIGRAFPLNRLIRIRLTNNLYHFATLTAAATSVVPNALSDLQMVFTPAVPALCEPAVSGGWLAPVSAIRYVVRNAVATSLNTPRFAAATGPMAQLVREEVLPTNPKTTAFGPPPRPILDYVVGFNLAFTMNADATPGNRDTYVIGGMPPNPGDPFSANTTNVNATVNGNPQRVRAVTIDIAVRTPEQDPTFQWTAAGCANMRCFRVFTDRPGAARVRRARTEVFLPNIASEGY